MLVIIDESGDPGFRVDEGSTSHFVVAMILFDDDTDAQRTSSSITQLRRRLRVKPEFKFTKSADRVRDDFFAEVSACGFRIRAIVVEKAAIHSPHLRTDSAIVRSHRTDDRRDRRWFRVLQRAGRIEDLWQFR